MLGICVYNQLVHIMIWESMWLGGWCGCCCANVQGFDSK